MPANPGPRNLFSEGKTASPRELQARLSGECAEFLEGAVQNPQFGEDHLSTLLSNPNLPGAMIQQIAGRLSWLSQYEVKRAIVMHGNAPRPLRMNLVHFLRWRDLVRVVEGRRSLPALKRAAETLLRSRMDKMTLGERVALARIATPAVLSSLRFDPNPEVIQALLRNGRLPEEIVLEICAEEQVPPQVLSLVARDSRWGSRYPVKMALLRNIRTPAATALRILESLLSDDLRELASSPQLPRLVKATAKKLLACRADFVDRDGSVT